MKLFLLPAATLLMANGAYASVRGATTEFAEVGAQWQCNMPDHSGCPRDRTEYICDDDQTACCDITFSNEEKKMRRTRKGRDNMKNLKQTVPLEGYGSCTLVDTDSSTSPDMFEFELSNKSVDDVLEELIAEEDEKAAELSNGIEFVEEESKSCSRTSQCRSGEFCNNSGRCQNRNNNRNYCRNQSDCVNRNDYCDYDRNECRRASGRSCQSGTDCGNGRGSEWMCRGGRCEPRSLFELAMERVMNGEAVMFDLDETMEEE